MGRFGMGRVGMGRVGMGRVLLISMPFSVPHYPSLGLGLLKPALTASGLDCEVRYVSLDYFETLGPTAHATLTDPAYYMAHVGEWVFAGVVNGQADSPGLAFLSECFAVEFPRYNTPERLEIFLHARAGAAAFIEACFAQTDWSTYDIVGFTTSYQQTMASLALAQRIKQGFPNVAIVFGGVNCLDEMGRALLQHYPYVDAVCLGEGDRCLPQWATLVCAGLPTDAVAGMAVRAAPPTSDTPDSIVEMDRLPYPDYDDFFAQHAASPQAAELTPALVFETARGCWWGERQNCTFCGLNGTNIRFRAKSPDRAFDELQYLVRRYGCELVANADKILDERYFDNFLPRLADSDLDLTIYYEVKVGLSPAQITLLARAGIRRVQFGIETFDTELLRLMAKGTTRLQNIEALKLCAEAGIYVEWLALSGFPGERPAQYDDLAQLLPSLFHLQPPAAFIRARADRFSPYERDPGRYAVTLDPLPAYRYIFPFDETILRRFANHFILRSPELAQHDQYVAGAAAQYAAWQDRFADCGLWYLDLGADGIEIHDRRGGTAEVITTWQGDAATIVRLCWRITRWHDIVSHLPDRPAASIAAAASALQAHHLLIHEGSRWLTLALHQPGRRRAPTWSEIRDRPRPARV